MKTHSWKVCTAKEQDIKLTSVTFMYTYDKYTKSFYQYLILHNDWSYLCYFLASNNITILKTLQNESLNSPLLWSYTENLQLTALNQIDWNFHGNTLSLLSPLSGSLANKNFYQKYICSLYYHTIIPKCSIIITFYCDPPL